MATLVLESGESLGSDSASLCVTRGSGGTCTEWLAVDVATAESVGGVTFSALSIDDAMTILSVALPVLALAWGFSLLKRQLGVFV